MGSSCKYKRSWFARCSLPAVQPVSNSPWTGPNPLLGVAQKIEKKHRCSQAVQSSGGLMLNVVPRERAWRHSIHCSGCFTASQRAPCKSNSARYFCITPFFFCFFFFFVKVKIFGFLMVSKKRVFCKSEEV